jgi:putative Ca2+/H+ antiporter (TMEM165/GDT1 family)
LQLRPEVLRLWPGAVEEFGMFASLAVSSAAIFIAELGDKSQLMALAFTARYRPWQVLLGITLATTLVHAVSVGLGVTLGAALPGELVSLVAGLAFLGFAAWTLRGDALSDQDNRRARWGGPALLVVTLAFMLAELGDKTMLATVTLATQHNWLGTWIGSTLGMVLADALAIGIGLLVGKHVPKKAVQYGAAALFAVFGGWLVFEALQQL